MLERTTNVGKDDTLCTGSPTLTLKKEISQGKVEEVFKTPLNKGQNVLQADTSRRSLRSTGRDTPVESDNEKMNLLDEEENDWQDEEMSTSPIFRLYESQGDVSYTLTESPAKKKRKRDEIKNANAKVGGLSKELPAKKKRKRDEIKNANAKVGGLSKELLEVQTFMSKPS
ncbi:hypothetical protein QE152_g25681 [Popillia japonica]|uniref:Uncharacterized protein n=1 Tax=Popillia japonica TaxID=7064 RepID=A0AAW1K0V7_POPJA